MFRSARDFGHEMLNALLVWIYKTPKPQPRESIDPYEAQNYTSYGSDDSAC